MIKFSCLWFISGEEFGIVIFDVYEFFMFSFKGHETCILEYWSGVLYDIVKLENIMSSINLFLIFFFPLRSWIFLLKKYLELAYHVPHTILSYQFFKDLNRASISSNVIVIIVWKSGSTCINNAFICSIRSPLIVI